MKEQQIQDLEGIERNQEKGASGRGGSRYRGVWGLGGGGCSPGDQDIPTIFQGSSKSMISL